MNSKPGSDTANPVIRAMGPGMIAGMVFAMWAMIVGIFYSALWAPPQGIAQAVGIGSPGHNFMLVSFILGVMGHMINSAILGMMFLGIARITHLHGLAAVVSGMIYGLIVYGVLYFIVLTGPLAATGGSFLSSNPEWSWALAHLMYGGVLGYLAAYGPLRIADEHTIPGSRPLGMGAA